MTHTILLQVSVEQFAGMISNVGFPMAAFYLMYRMATNTISENTAAINNLRIQLEGMSKNE
jgi:hypothetical protein